MLRACAFGGGCIRPSSLRAFQRFRSNRLQWYLEGLQKCHNDPSCGARALDKLSRLGFRDETRFEHVHGTARLPKALDTPEPLLQPCQFHGKSTFISVPRVCKFKPSHAASVATTRRISCFFTAALISSRSSRCKIATPKHSAPARTGIHADWFLRQQFCQLPPSAYAVS